MHVPTPILGRQNPKVCLQCDGIPKRCCCRRFEHHGAVFDLPCRLELMSVLLLAVEWTGAGCRRWSVKITGTVVGCLDIGEGCFETTVLFLPGSGMCASTEFRHLPN